MENKIKIILLGGDLRHYTAACRLAECYSTVGIWGIDVCRKEKEGSLVCFETPALALADADVVVLPLPTSTDTTTLNAPLEAGGQPWKLRTLLEWMKKDALLIGGRIPASFAKEAVARGHRVIDFFESEPFQMQNAYTTAEAAISIAMNSLSRELRGARIGVTGYGRIAKHLVRLLLDFRAEVTVAARKESDRAYVASLGCKTCDLSEEVRGETVLSLASGYDVIFNTVPFWLFGRDFLKKVDPETVLIELASAPGGIDVCAAKELRSNVLWASSLPGKYAPQSAGLLIASCVEDILKCEVEL